MCRVAVPEGAHAPTRRAGEVRARRLAVPETCRCAGSPYPSRPHAPTRRDQASTDASTAASVAAAANWAL